ncbi:hypothetical protein Q8A67_022524 [Cirrhinus molitorella]|uniref:Uncharacterized protein n=1 Tax=Cirrhinus molitorella TaxID=172907 RepID=A0AA88TC73_9TELE|nr:hypothetical protein Q8A67_022524 [Cirrhinus molitorella]
MLMFPHPWMLLRRLNRPGSARQARVALAVLRRSSSRPCQDDPHSLCERGQACHESDTMALILCADEVWRGRRSEFCLCSTEQISHALDTQRTRRGLGSGSLSVGASCVVALLSGAAWALRVAVEPYQMVKRRRCREAPPIYEQTKAPASSPAPKLKDSKEGGEVGVRTQK